VVDEKNRPLAMMSLAEIHRQSLFHRSVVVLVYNMDNKLYIQKRGPAKPFYAGKWGLSCMAHVLADEAGEEAAIRELAEDLDIRARKLKLLYEVEAAPETGFEFMSIYTTGRIGFTPSPDPCKVEDGYFVDRSELGCLIQMFPELLTPSLVYFWQKDLIFPLSLPKSKVLSLGSKNSE